MIERATQQGRVFYLQWDNGINICVSKIREQHNGDLRGQVTIRDGDVDLHQTMMNLSTDHSRNITANVMKTLNGNKPWTTIFSDMSREVINRLSQGQPLEIIKTDEEIPPEQYLLEPLLPFNEPTILFGLGGSGKSYLADLIAICLLLRWSQNPFGWKIKDNKHHNVLYLDWETNKDRVAKRAQRIVKGMNLPHLFFGYRRCIAPLIDDLEAIQQLLMETKAGLVIIDSAGRACGGDLKDAAVVNTFFTALRELDTSVLIIHHRSKDDLNKNKTPFGSAYFENNARSVWQVEKEQQTGESELIISITNTKMNDAEKQKPVGIKVLFDNVNWTTRFEPVELKGTAFESHLPLWERIRDLLLEGARSEKEIAEVLGENQGSVRTSINRHKDVFIKTQRGHWGVVTNEV